jgi:cytochrome c peroxidase
LAAWAGERPRQPLGLPSIEWPKNNPYSAAKAELGRLLYFDKRLSADGTVSCATCHEPEHAYTDGFAVSTGIGGQKGNRSAPTVINRAFSLAQFWDGRAATLEEQAKGPIANPIEMGNTHEACAATISKIAGYRPLFAKAFGNDQIDIDRIAMAIATFERTILSGNAPYDRYKKGDKKAMSAEQVRGMSVFFDKAKCDRCHENSNFTLNAYSNIGIGMDKPDPDVGRYSQTKDSRDWGVFKVPTLRDIEHTAPYMHDGSLKTLEEVVDYYDKGGTPNKNLDGNIRKLNLTDQEKKDLVSFLKALSGEGWQAAQPPAEFPQ